jgi:hypothetical protein
MAAQHEARYLIYMKQVTIFLGLAALILSTGCADVGAFMAKSHYVGNKLPVYNSRTGKVQYVYSPHMVPNQPYEYRAAPAPSHRP